MVSQPVNINEMANKLAEAFIIFGSAGDPVRLQLMLAQHRESTVQAVKTFLEVIYAESPEPRPDNLPPEG